MHLNVFLFLYHWCSDAKINENPTLAEEQSPVLNMLTAEEEDIPGYSILGNTR